MRRLPQERMLDELLRAHTVTTAEIEALADHVARFHASTEVLPADRALAAGRRAAALRGRELRRARRPARARPAEAPARLAGERAPARLRSARRTAACARPQPACASTATATCTRATSA
jgi:hypothetical protein